MRCVFLGPPGSGKGTQARMLSERLGPRVIGTGDILRDAVARGTDLGKQVEPFLATGNLAPDDLVNRVVAELFHRDDHPTQFVMDGYPRTLSQAVAFDSILRRHFLDLEHVYLFVVPEQELIRRLRSRRDREGREDDIDETIRRRLSVYQANTQDLVEHYRREGLVREIDALADKETVYQSLLSHGSV